MVSQTDRARMQDIASRLWDAERRWAPGEIAWSVLAEPDGHAVSFVDDGFVWVQEDTAVIVLPRGAHVSDALDRCATHSVQATTTDSDLIDALHARGYGEDASAPFDLTVRLGVHDAVGRPADGCVARAARRDDDLVGVHVASWRPADLPFAPGKGPQFDEAAASDFTAARLAAVQRCSLYRAELHVVAVALDGRLAGSCIAWLDEPNRVGAIEPLGVAAEHRNRGVAGALCVEAARLLAEAGATEVLIHPRGDAAYPAARGAYARAGFETVGRTAIFRPG